VYCISLSKEAVGTASNRFPVSRKGQFSSVDELAMLKRLELMGTTQRKELTGKYRLMQYRGEGIKY